MRGYKNLKQILTMEGVHQKDGRRVKQEDLSIIEDGALIYNDKEILWVGKTKDIPKEYFEARWVDGSQLCVTPEIVDGHTHCVFGGNRSFEYTMRLNGADYEEIGNAGGGILSTMKHTNEESINGLFESAKARVERIASYGVGTVEIKTGYGLNIQKEIDCAKVIQRLKEYFEPRIQIFSTFMPAHAIPKEFKDGSEYLEKVVYPAFEAIIPLGIINAADIFFEKGYFGKEDTEKFFKFCREKNIPIKVHADEFNDNGGAALACEYQALSCDHLLKTGKDGIEALAKSNTVATILPGTGFFLGKSQADARKLWDSGAKVAMASDYNPGSCHCDNLILIAGLAAPTLKLSFSEVWTSITYNAAHSLGLKNQGVIQPGFRPRFSFFQVPSIDEITYSWGRNFAKTE